MGDRGSELHVAAGRRTRERGHDRVGECAAADDAATLGPAMKTSDAVLVIVIVTGLAGCAASRTPAGPPSGARPAVQPVTPPSARAAARPSEPSPTPMPTTARKAATPSGRGTAPAAGRGRPAAAEEPIEGFGATTSGGAGGRVIVVDGPTEDAVRAAFLDANGTGNAIIRFAVRDTIPIAKKLPILTAPNLTLEGNGATLDGSDMKEGSAIVDIRTHDVIVRDLRLRNGDDNLRLQGPDAHHIAVTHVSSTGSNDDGISIGYGAHDVTVQYGFFAGDTRSVYCKYPGTDHISLHHTWIAKGAIRSPLFSGHLVADMRNVIVEDWGEWGSRFEDGASGNVVSSLFALSPYAESIGGKPHAALRFKDAGDVYTAGNTSRGLALPPLTGTASAPIAVPPVRTQTVGAMEPIVRARAGCLPHDAIDTAYMTMASGWSVAETRPMRLSGSMPRVEKRE